ncbi:hypothetical protein [Streptomyces sp. LaBMicrA B280]|uniref:hypothetical protein n=1 Tax=Streptomyces sp. LaBMicrA B280 TaxID=3391001 RepID=UPI003BA68891
MPAGGHTAALMGAFLAPATVTGPGWLRVSRRIGKQNGPLLSQAVFVAGSYAPAPTRRRPPRRVAAPARAPTPGCGTATEAAGTALGAYAHATVLALGGFVSTTEGRSVRQPHAAHLGLPLGGTTVPAVLMAVAMACQRRCRLDRR